jgi:ParB family chromosome partitioning protein
VREAEQLVHMMLHPALRKTRQGATRRIDADGARLETELAEALGAPVRIEPSRKGGGRIVIRYSSLDQLDGILTRLRQG